MSYEQFAYLYDELMKDAPYDEWVRFVKDRLKENGGNRIRFLDLACGTGELSIRFAKEGFDVTGVDLSEDMLAVARAKSEEQGMSISFYQQDMTKLEGHGQFDIIGIFCDSLNYLKTEEDVIQTFSSVHQHLKPGGLFIFDVHSIFKISQIFINQTFALNDEHVSYIWNSFPGEFPNSVEHDLSFFVLDEKIGMYDRFDELHFQRTYPMEDYKNWLIQAGFEGIKIYADFENTAPGPQSERIFFVVR
ncbi:methyltransferase domain-containing protein [Neobacillus niacini]|uniref:class I SAM-dependent DNA methyltransferase n=1 Tax=Neobacillus niacini TaxID=86668 RepID=UPI00286363EB|nr:methyltransferase domain-containing protein [Neobacillus niacini]MDR7000388.1 SAM-dependent methyltransferase [Neobacillus niacini]